MITMDLNTATNLCPNTLKSLTAANIPGQSPELRGTEPELN